MGNFGQTGAWVIANGAGSLTVEQLKPEPAYQRRPAVRQRFGFEMLPATGGPHPSGVMARRLRSGKLACLAAGRDLSRTGVPVTSIQPAGSDTAPTCARVREERVSHPYFAAYSPAPNWLICACATNCDFDRASRPDSAGRMWRPNVRGSR